MQLGKLGEVVHVRVDYDPEVTLLVVLGLAEVELLPSCGKEDLLRSLMAKAAADSTHLCDLIARELLRRSHGVDQSVREQVW